MSYVLDSHRMLVHDKEKMLASCAPSNGMWLKIVLHYRIPKNYRHCPDCFPAPDDRRN